MRLNEIKPARGAKHGRKRVGRGIGSGLGKTAGRGHKGQKARTGGFHKIGFEGGQMPLQRRVPKAKGFRNPSRVAYAPVNVELLARYFDGEVTPEALYAHGLARKGRPVKVLGRGELDKALVVKAHAVSAGARAKIEAAGGSVELIAPSG